MPATAAERPATAEPKGAIRVTGARVEYPAADGGRLLAVEEANLDVGAGEFVSIVGPSGCGKTTLLMAIAGLAQLAAYCGMSALGVVGYGSAFLLLGTLLRSPGYLVAVFFGWEWFEFLLPPLLKQLSVVHYIKVLTPVPIAEGPFALLAEPVPTWQAVLKVLVYAAVAVSVAAWSASRQDLNYGEG